MVPAKTLTPAPEPISPVASPPPVRPMARAERIAIFEREVRERLSRAAIEVLFARADLLSEGQRLTRAGKQLFEGSTMLTLDLGRTSALFREVGDAATARRLAAMLAKDTWARNRVRQIATKEAERLSHTKVREVSAEMRVSSKGSKVLIDVDVEAKL